MAVGPIVLLVFFRNNIQASVPVFSCNKTNNIQARYLASVHLLIIHSVSSAPKSRLFVSDENYKNIFSHHTHRSDLHCLTGAQCTFISKRTCKKIGGIRFIDSFVKSSTCNGLLSFLLNFGCQQFQKMLPCFCRSASLRSLGQ